MLYFPIQTGQVHCAGLLFPAPLPPEGRVTASDLASKDLKITAVDSTALQREYNQLTSAFKSIIENLATYISVTTSITTEYYDKLKKPVKS